MRCFTADGVHIPGCMGCAALGHDRCTCIRPAKRRSEIERLLDEIGGDAYLSAVGEITPQAAMTSIQNGVRQVRALVAASITDGTVTQ